MWNLKIEIGNLKLKLFHIPCALQRGNGRLNIKHSTFNI